MVQNSHPNTPDRLADALTAEGFVCDPGRESGLLLTIADWWEVADENLNVVARVTATVEDGVAVYAFTGGRAMLLSWEAKFSSPMTPVAVIAATAKAAAAPALARYMHAEATS